MDQRVGHRRHTPQGLKLLSTLALGFWFTTTPFVQPGATERPVIVALGDSLTAGYELAANDAFPAQLQAKLSKLGLPAEVRNAGVSGDTALGGLNRLDWSIEGKVDLVIVELGANDALRGLDPQQTEAALDQILAKVKARGAKAILAGMLAPPNMGPDYAKAFNAIYPKLAAKYQVPLDPFFMDGVATKRNLLLKDQLHPTPEGVAIIAERLAPMVIKTLQGR